MSRLGTVGDVFSYLAKRRKFWLIPCIAIVICLGLVIVLSEGTALAPFIYAMF